VRNGTGKIKTIMAVQTVKISDVKSNPNNPRLIKDDKFLKLVQSLKDFPEMAKVRPIVVNQDFIVLGGNMRLKAMKEAGWKDVPVEVVDWTEQQQKEFIIKDNVGFGEWEWDILANEWEADDLEKWGLDVPGFEDSEQEDLSDKITDTYRIEIVCESEEMQQQAYNDLIEQGYECRLLTL
jgi:ParB-like chromosome segregation protein Spo0J